MNVKSLIKYFSLTILIFSTQNYAINIRGPAMVETQIYLLDSYIPAAMQVIAFLTEMMKYDLQPPTVTTTQDPFTGNTKPTSTHKPGIYAPEQPLGPEAYEKSGDDQDLQQGLQLTLKDFEEAEMARSKSATSVVVEELPKNLENLIGENIADLLKFINSQSPPQPFADVDEQVQIFSENLDDSDFRFYLQKNKTALPTRAYVTLLSLYDLLSKDAKNQGYNKYNGYHDHVLIELSKTSSGTSANQLRFVLQKILINQDTKEPKIKKKIESLLEDLRNEESYLNKAIKDIEPLQFRV